MRNLEGWLRGYTKLEVTQTGSFVSIPLTRKLLIWLLGYREGAGDASHALS